MNDDVKHLTHDGTTYRLPFADLFRPLSVAEEAELRASVKDTGVLYPVVVYDSETWGANCVIDGANRLRIAAEEGLSVAFERLALNDVEARRRAEDLNIARRQVTPEEAREARSRRIERVVAARAEGKSTRAIAEEEGVSQSQVVADLKAGEHPCSPQPDAPAGEGPAREPKPTKVRGKDGKSYAAKKPVGKPVSVVVEPTEETGAQAVSVRIATDAPTPAYRQYVPVEEVTAKVTKRQLVDEDLSGPARARLIQGLEAAKLVVTAITEAIDGLRSEKLNPLELPARFAAIAEQLKQSAETFAELSAMPIEDVSTTVLRKYAGAVTAKGSKDAKAGIGTPLAVEAQLDIAQKLSRS